MRIENAINEIRGTQKNELRSQGPKNKKAAQNSVDRVDISPSAKALTHTNTNAVRHSKIEQAKERVRDGFYDRPEVLEAIADAIMDSGVIDPVVKETQEIRVATERLSHVPDLREHKIAEVKERIQRGFYDLPVIRDQIAGKVSESLIG